MIRGSGADTLYFGREFCCVGDQNGDGVDDIVIKSKDVWDTYSDVYILSGNRDWTVDAPEIEIPEKYDLTLHSHPNPFNSETFISFDLPKKSHINLSVYDVRGRLIETLMDQERRRGHHYWKWSHRVAGLYFISLKTEYGSAVMKVVCLK